jgi:hypothetical protein
VRTLAVADEPRDVVHQERLPREQLHRGSHPPRREILLEGAGAELRVRPLELARRARQRARQVLERQRAAVVARDEHAREQVQPAALADGAGAHVPFSDRFRGVGPQPA